MTEEARISTREAAQRLHVHARTIRKWIDSFEEYIAPEANERGHYKLTEEGFRRLSDIQQRLQEPNKTMRQIRQDLMKEGKWEVERVVSESDASKKEEEVPKMPFGSETPVHRIIGSLDEIGEMMETVFARLDHLEDHVFTMFDVMEQMEAKISSQSQQSMVPATTVQQMMDEVSKRQEQLRAELRNATFTHRLASATSENAMTPPRRQKRTRFLGIF
ncbi:MerR family transcriptional regulator [Marininema halotolerans]|uniref:MerR HTH family regulatory protein n=1 Tax=Marininema halotolerans TaxID=1155944 RepID=A0A1I6RLJ2_9BACL|nr:MerR family transcriptional regulator [Marininema halotolerans]SFS65623.1 MerR HTH family regulatory protein [Marininema halotolerans]